MSIFSGLKRLLARSGTNNSKPDRSTLVGMYLNQANSKDGYSSEQQQNRQRRNGKYSHNRERA